MRRSTTKAATATAPTGVPKRKRKSRRRVGRRSPQAIAKLSEEILDYVRAYPGQRLEQIAAEMNLESAELKEPMRKLRDDGRLRIEVQKRGTMYFLGKGAM